jgi:signal transduction histidine kinase
MVDARDPGPSTFAIVPSLHRQLESACADLLGPDAATAVDLQQFIETMSRILETAKLEALAEFAAGAGHEINNPVATIVGRAQLLLSDEKDLNRAQALQIIGGQALRIRDMIGDVMLFARPPHARPEFLNLLDLAVQSQKSQFDLIRQRQANICFEIPEDQLLWADRTQTLVLLSSLLRNSLESGDQSGIEICLSATIQVRNGHDWSVLRLEDDGPGISAAAREHLFDPFFSARQAGRGLGFGLSKCWRIVQIHGGAIEVPELPNGNTRFDIWLPLPTT